MDAACVVDCRNVLGEGALWCRIEQRLWWIDISKPSLWTWQPATNKAEQVRGEGDGERNRIFADAYGRDADFFAFYRAMQAYEAGLRHNDTRMLLKPDSEFFRFFVDPSGKPREGNSTSGATSPAR